MTRNGLAIGALLAAAVAPYLLVLDLPFLSDDYHAVAHASRGGEALLEDLTGPQFEAATVRFWRPLVTASLVLDHALFGLEAASYRATNLLFHAASVLLVFALGRSLGLPRGSAFLAALLFAAFPYGPGAVAWVVGRVDALAAPFFLGALVLHERRAPAGRVSWGALACAALSLSTKEVAAALPFSVLALELARRGGILRSVHRASPFLAMGLAYLVARRLALGVWVGGYPPNPEGAPLAEAAAGLGGAVSQVLLPGTLAGWEGTLAGWAALAAIAGLARSGGSCAGGAGLGLGLWLLAAAPAFEVLRRPDDLPNLRVLYLPSAGLALALAAVRSGSRHRLSRLAPAVLLVPMGIGLSRSLADHRAAGRDVERTLQAVRRGSEVCPGPEPLFVAGVPRVQGTAYSFHWGFGSATSAPFRTEGPVVRLLRPVFSPDPGATSWEAEPPAGRCLVRLQEGGSVEIFPARERRAWRVSSPAFEGTIHREALQAAWDGEDFPIEFDGIGGEAVEAAVFTSVGFNAVRLEAAPRRLLRDVLVREFAPALTLTHVIVQAFDAGDREILFCFRSGDLESDLLRFRVAEDVALAFREFYLQ